jgi:lipid-binding SYLF domain-containing protein
MKLLVLISFFIFLSVFKAGIGIGSKYGEGALRIDGKTVDDLGTAAASIGFQPDTKKKPSSWFSCSKTS